MRQHGGGACPWLVLCGLLVLASACTREPAAVERPDFASADVVPVDVEPISGPSIEIATWNVERFFDIRCDSGRCGPGDFEAQPTPNDFEREADRVADGIRDLGADVVLLQEIESELCMIALRERLPEYTVAILAEKGRGGVNVGVMAKGELVAQRRYGGMALPHPDGGTTSFAREFLEVQLRVGSEAEAPDVVVFVGHFKSKNGDDPGRRLAEAVAARDIVAGVAAELPDALVVFGGDLNDTPGSPPLDALLVDTGLRRAGTDVSNELVATYTFNGTRRAIDHLLWATGASGDYVATSAAARRDRDAEGFAGSDHAALEAQFVLPDVPR